MAGMSISTYRQIEMHSLDLNKHYDKQGELNKWLTKL